jgi:hypothetical protein
MAWRLSGDMEWMQEVVSWDLWQVTLGELDEVRELPHFGPVLDEVRVYSPIPADRVWLAGWRDGEHPEAEPAKSAKRGKRKK